MVPETSGVRFFSPARKSLSPMTDAGVNLFARGKKTPATRDYSPFPGSQRLYFYYMLFNDLKYFLNITLEK
jgi:hypothetical protein